MTGLRKLNNKKEDTSGLNKRTILLLGAMVLIVLISVTAVGAIIAYIVFPKDEGSSEDEYISPEELLTSTTAIPTTTTTSTTTSTSTSSLITSTSSSSTTSTLSLPTTNSSQSGLYCRGKKVPEDWLTSENKSVPDGAVRAVLCISGFGQPKAYASKMDSIRNARGVIRASITYKYPIGYVIYDPTETNMDDISSILGDYDIEIIKDGIK